MKFNFPMNCHVRLLVCWIVGLSVVYNLINLNLGPCFYEIFL